MPYREKIIFQLAALAALFLLPIGLVVGILISVEDAAINIARSEQAGAGYLRALGPVLKAVEVHQYDRSVDLSGIAHDLKAAQARFGAKIDASAAARAAIDDAVIAKKRKRGSTGATKNQPMGLRWPVERTNSWLSNFGQLRRNTDRFSAHRLAQFALAVALIITVKLVKWAKRWDSLAVA